MVVHDNILERLNDLTKEYLLHVCAHDATWCASHTAPKVSAIVGSPEHYLQGIDELAHMVRGTGKSTFHHPSDVYVSTVAKQLDDEYYIVLSRSQLRPGTVTAGPCSEDQCQLGTFLWLVSGSEPLLEHLHLSITDRNSGPEAGVFSQPSAAERGAGATDGLLLRDTRGTAHRLACSDVLFLEASRQHTIVHCTGKRVVVNMGLRRVAELFGADFMLVHRSFVVNLQHVAGLERASILLDDGSVVPLPQRRAAAVRSQVAEAIAPQRLASTSPRSLSA